MTELSCRAFFEGLEGKFRPDEAARLEAVFQFEILGEGGGHWMVEVEGEACRVSEGRAEAPSLTAVMSAADFVQMVNGRLNPQMAFVSGRLSIRPANLELARAFGRMFFTSA